jgi:AcrR family transcriptional regulator
MPSPGVTRKAILEAARDVLAQEGLLAISTRRVARQAGVNQALVHYHFKSIEQLLLEVLLESREFVAPSLSDIFDSEGGLLASWRAYSHRAAGADYPAYVPSLWLQTVTLAATNATLARAYQETYLEPVHDVIHKAASESLGEGPESSARAEGITALIMAVQRSVLIDRLLGSSHGHEELFALVEGVLETLLPGHDQAEPRAVDTAPPPKKRASGARAGKRTESAS